MSRKYVAVAGLQVVKDELIYASLTNRLNLMIWKKFRVAAAPIFAPGATVVQSSVPA